MSDNKNPYPFPKQGKTLIPSLVTENELLRAALADRDAKIQELREWLTSNHRPEEALSFHDRAIQNCYSETLEKLTELFTEE